MRTREIEANGLTFRAREHGDTGSTPVLLLHGFPETSHMWQPLMERLGQTATARASFYVYNNRDDVDALIDALIYAEGFFKNA